MHKYLRAIGFSEVTTKEQLHDLLYHSAQHATEQSRIALDGDVLFSEFSKEFAENVGIALRGECSESNRFSMDYYFPYCIGTHISSVEEITVERHAEKEAYSGVCDDLKMGVSMIFYLRNVIPYMQNEQTSKLLPVKRSLVLAGLALDGRIMLPIVKNETDKQKVKQASKVRNQLIAAARQGDEEAMETLTLEDMDTYSTISKRIQREDVFSLVDTYFMPIGVECDHYSILGEIVSFKDTINSMSKEALSILTLECNEVLMDICINKKDLIGEPAIGRRFKGNIWLQGLVNFS